jgi:hypothetical protein
VMFCLMMTSSFMSVLGIKKKKKTNKPL